MFKSNDDDDDDDDDEDADDNKYLDKKQRFIFM